MFGEGPRLERRTIRHVPTHKDFIVELLNKFPQIVTEPDTYGWLPLHYAAKLGSEEVVELILQKEPSMAYRKDNNGMTALLIAAKEGYVGVLKTIVKLCPDSCEMLDYYDRTALHVAVAKRRINASLTLLKMPSFRKMVNRQDKDGNTAFHLAAISEDIIIVLLMLAFNRRVDMNIVNNKDLTTYDIIVLSPEFGLIKKFLGLKMLELYGAVKGMRQVLARKAITNDDPKNSDSEKQKEKVTELERNAVSERTRQENINKSQIWSEWSNANLVVATIIATVTFSAAIQVPGGYDKDGMALLRKQKSFRQYLIFDTLSFGFAVASMFLTFLFGSSGAMKYFLPKKFASFLTGCSLILMAFAFMKGMALVVDEKSHFSQWLIFLCGLSLGLPFYFISARLMIAHFR